MMSTQLIETKCSHNDEITNAIDESNRLREETTILAESLKDISERFTEISSYISQMVKQSEVLILEFEILNHKYVNLLENRKRIDNKYATLNKSQYMDTSWMVLKKQSSNEIIIEIKLLNDKKILLNINEFANKTFANISEMITNIFISDYQMTINDFCGMRWIINGEIYDINPSILKINIPDQFINQLKIHKKINIIQHKHCKKNENGICESNL